ncbi:MAG: PEP-CTERM sorting domain-containing protein [Phycisphaerae bacterium]|jgi:hypothetical protein
MRRFFLLLTVLILFTGFTSRVSADDGEWGSEVSPIDVNWIGDDFYLDLDHEDADPWKGWGTIWLKNICGEDWGDFHFQIKSIFGSNIENVDFTGTPELWVRTGLFTWEQVDNLAWQVNNDTVGATLDLYFYDNPIAHGDLVKFKIYTDNTIDKCSWFRVSGYATPVPEPATMGFLGFGALALLRKKK